MKQNVTAYLCGLLFALGLGVSQMTMPPKILGFLNVFGNWDPTLLVVFVAATGTYLIANRWIIDKSITGQLEEYLKGKEKVEPHVFIGAVIFGLGWGLAGLCPGPALTDIATGQLPIYVFVAGMIAGMLLLKLSACRS